MPRHVCFTLLIFTDDSVGLSDVFWTNKTYAKVGGVSVRELSLLELELLTRVEWRIVPASDKLQDYYINLVARSQGYDLEEQSEGMTASPDEVSTELSVDQDIRDTIDVDAARVVQAETAATT